MGTGRRRMLAVLAAGALIAAGCGDDGDDGGGGAAGEGGTVTIFGAFVDAEAAAFEAALAPFEEASGIDIRYEGSGSFNDLIRIRAEADDLADIVVFPQPGLMAEFARDGRILPLSGVALDAFNDNYSAGWQSDGSVDDTPYGIWIKAAVKSLVWYPTPQFEDAGYEIPEDWDALLALSQQIVDDGGTPWCIGIESAEATGWVATDWMEDIILRLHGGDVYDQWVNHEIPFDDPQIVEAADMLNEIWQNPDFVRGGTQTILTTPFGDSPRSLFDDPPGCFMHRQANFISESFPDDVQASLATDDPAAAVFPLPAIEGGAAPVLTAGDVAAMTSDGDAVLQAMAFLGTRDFAEGWASAGGYFSPHEGFDASLYTTEIERQIGGILADASEVRFDGSDLMPGEVGAGTFWTGMVELVGGGEPADVLADIDASFPA
ncbi:MAG: ABC transporter substrate-binding protein [Acidimicrobiales bacterium]